MSIVLLGIALIPRPTPCAAVADKQTTYTFHLERDDPASVRFTGSTSADLFTKEIAMSLKGVLEKNYVSDSKGKYPAGFLHASPIPQVWSGSFWTRDGGVFGREMVLWGYTEHACLTAQCLMQLVDKNDEGYYAFPRFFSPDKPPQPATELDGDASIIIAMVRLWQRLPEDNPFRATLYRFLHQESSPVRFLVHELEKGPLLAGSGEFGPGCSIKGCYYNSVQNHLCAMALVAAAEMEQQAGDTKTAELYRASSRKIWKNMLKYLVDSDGSWIWCIDPKTMKIDPKVENHKYNLGFGGRNGVACMYSDVYGLEPLASHWEGAEHCLKTFDKLYAVPKRKEQFDKNGIWTQFDILRGGWLTGPSYGDGYALQTMLLYDRLDMADKSVNWIANCTYQPTKSYKPHRDSPYYFMEANYSPDAEGKIKMVEGCGALNLVNVGEPLKIARLIIGIDDTSLDEVRLVPRVPPSWAGYEAKNWPILTSRGVVRADIQYERSGATGDATSASGTGGKPRLSIHVRDGGVIPKLAVRLPHGKDFVRLTREKVSDATFE